EGQAPPMKNADFGGFLVRAPLYRSELIEDPEVISVSSGWQFEMPETITRDCEGCQLALNWDRTAGRYLGSGIGEVWYRCRNCGRGFDVIVRVAIERQGERFIAEVEKVGQYPKLEVTIPKDFAAARGVPVALSRKGMTSRHNNYGIGALTYFRRLVEDTTDEMLALLGDAMKEIAADPGLLEKLAEVQAGTRFEDKVKFAAEIIPTALQPGGVNPFGDLYALLSIGLHELSDEEC